MARAKPSAQPFLVFYGGEDFLLDRELNKVRKWDKRTVVLLNGHDTDEHALVSACTTVSMDEALRVIVVDDAQKIKDKSKRLKEYIEEKESSDISVILAAFVRSEKLPEIWALAASKGRSVEHRKLKTWDNNNEVIAWVESEAVRMGLRLQKGLAQSLYDLVGADLYRLSSEIQKLALLVGKSGEVTINHLKLALSPSPTAEPWQVAEAAIQKDSRRAMNLLSTLYKNQGDDANVPLVNALIRQVEKLVLARQMVDGGCSEDEIAALVEMSPKRVKFFYLPQVVQKHVLAQLVKHMSRLCQLDVEVKGSSRSKRTLVEIAVLSISG